MKRGQQYGYYARHCILFLRQQFWLLRQQFAVYLLAKTYVISDSPRTFSNNASLLDIDTVMTFLYCVFTCLLLLALANASDKCLKDFPKTEQAIDTDNENTTEDIVVVFAPPVSDGIQPVVNGSDISISHETSDDTTAFCSEDPGCGSVGSNTTNFARRYNVSSETDTLVSQSRTIGTASEDTNADLNGAQDKGQEQTDTEALEQDITRVPDIELITEDITPLDDQVPKTQEMHSSESVHDVAPDSNNDNIIGDVEQSQLDHSIADVRISDLKAMVYQMLGRVLEKTNTYDERYPWWNYIILNHNDLDINRRQQRYIEESSRPGLEFLDILDESGYTMQDLEILFMRYQIHEALDILRSHQYDVIGGRRDSRTVPEPVVRDIVTPDMNSQEDISESGEGETDKENDDRSPKVGKENVVLHDKYITNDDKTDSFTQEKLETLDTDHCIPNPCKNEGKCISDENGYTCKCSYKWYSGKNCEIDNGPCINACFKPGTSSCDYSGPSGQITTCNCKVGYDGDQCETGHDYAQYPLIRNVINSCNERGLSQNECITDTLGVGTDVNSLEGLFQKLVDGEVNFNDIVTNVASKLLPKRGKQILDKLKNIF